LLFPAVGHHADVDVTEDGQCLLSEAQGLTRVDHGAGGMSPAGNRASQHAFLASFKKA